MTRSIGPAPRPGSGDAAYAPKPYREATSAKSPFRGATSMLISSAIIYGGERPKRSAARGRVRAGSPASSAAKAQPGATVPALRYDASTMEWYGHRQEFILVRERAA